MKTSDGFVASLHVPASHDEAKYGGNDTLC